MILSDSLLERVLSAALENGADFAEVYAENTYTSSLSMMDSKLTNAMVGCNFGAGIRLYYGGESIYTHTNDLSEASLIQSARRASQAFKGDSSRHCEPLVKAQFDTLQNLKVLPWEVSKATKLEYLNRFDRAARSEESVITQVLPNIKEVHSQIQIANSEGLLAEEVRQYSSCAVQTVAEKEGQKEVGSERAGFYGSSETLEMIDMESMSKKAANMSARLLDAGYAPAGEMHVVMAGGFGGVIFHEACGHGLETSAIQKGASVFCGKMGQKIANECVTAIDDGTLPGKWGSITMDDEGMPTQKTVLIENGVLKSYLVDRMGSFKTDYARTGSGRRESYKFAPASRMRNTYIDAGESSFEEMVGDLDDGLYAKTLGGGSVNPGTGAYNFTVHEGYIIKNGQLGNLVKGASLIGTGIDTLGRITKVGNDLEFANGTCGSASGWIPTTVGQPHIQISSLTVGGRA